MNIIIRPLAPPEFASAIRVDMLAFAEAHSDAAQSVLRDNFDFGRSRAAIEDDRVVALSGALSMHVTVPGGLKVPAAGISWVGVLPTHRRRGLLRRMMAALLDDARQRNEPLAILTASEGSIYGRFGFGVASDRMAWDLTSDRAAFCGPQEDYVGAYTLHDPQHMIDILPAIYERTAMGRPGAVTRPDEWWRVALHFAQEGHKGGQGPLAVTYTSPAGQVEGYVRYHVDKKWEQGLATSTLVVDDLAAATPTAYAALWRYCLNIDLVQTVSAANRPIDEPLRWLLAEPRQMRVTRVADDVWVCLLDVATALAARRYAVAGSLVIEVHEPNEPDEGARIQRFHLEGGPESASCTPTTAPADLVLSMAALGSVYLGAPRWGSLATAGVAREETTGALALANAMFACSPQPWSGTGF